MLIFVSRKLIHKRELLKYLYCKIFSLVVELVNKADNLCFHWPRRMRILGCDWPTLVIGRSVGCCPRSAGNCQCTEDHNPSYNWTWSYILEVSIRLQDNNRTVSIKL